MKRELIDILNSYSVVTYYDEVRDENDLLLFCNGHSFDLVDIDNITKYIILTNKNDDSSKCILNPDLKYEIIPLKYAIDKLILTSGNKIKTLFCKKN